MEAFSTYGMIKNESVSRYICGPDFCKFYSRPVDVKSYPGDNSEIEYDSEGDKPAFPCKKKKVPKKQYISRATQTDYRESETQTDPWDPPYVVKKVFKEPEVLQLKELSYGNGLPVSRTEIEYILENRKNIDIDVFTETNAGDYESFAKKKEIICNQVRNEWNYKVSKQNERLLDKLKQMETTLSQELTVKSDRQEKLLKNLWSQKKEEMSKMNSKLQNELKKELNILEKRTKSATQRFDAKSYGVEPISKEFALHIKNNRDSLNRDIDYLLNKYHMNPKGLTKLTEWLERKRTDLHNEIPVAKPVQKSKRDKLIEMAYQDFLVKKQAKMPPRVYREDHEKEESIASSLKSEVDFEILELPEEGVDLVTVWQQVLRGRAYQKQMLELIERHKDSLDVLLPSQVLGKS